MKRPSIGQEAKPIVHDAEYYLLDAQHGERWAAEDKNLDAKLAELRKKFGTPPNVIHVMWDDTPVGEIGIPFIQKQRGWETPNLNRFAAEGINFARMYTEPSCTPQPSGCADRPSPGAQRHVHRGVPLRVRRTGRLRSLDGDGVVQSGVCHGFQRQVAPRRHRRELLHQPRLRRGAVDAVQSGDERLY